MNKSNIDIIQMSSHVRQEPIISYGKEWVLNGQNNDYYQYIIDRYNGSPTNSAIIDSYTRMVYGLGLNIDIPLFEKKEVRRIVKDFVMFGEASFELMYLKNKPAKTIHVPKEKMAPEKANEDGKIVAYFNCYDWNKTNLYPPKRIDAFRFGKGANRSEIVPIRDYQVGQFYFSNPSYLSAMPYAELEEEIANYCINHIKNSFSAGAVVNMNNGIPESEEEKGKIVKDIERKYTGSKGAGRLIVSFNDNKETATTVENFVITDAYQQYTFLSEEARRQICVGHKVVSTSIIGIDKTTGFSSNAEEIQTAFNETMLNVIQPIQEIILDAFQEVAELAGIKQTLEFILLRQPKSNDVTSGQPTNLSKIELNPIAEELIELGEDIDTEFWELVDECQVNGEPMLTETALHLAKVPSSFPNVTSEQDTSLFKIRYQYAGETTGQRDFCNKMVNANKVYRKEDIELAGSKVVNAGLGLNGADTYSIWLYKGGVNCKHFWMRKIYLRKGNNSISVNDAKKMILALDPDKRKDAKWQENDKLVAQPAQESNNYFKAPK